MTSRRPASPDGPTPPKRARKKVAGSRPKAAKTAVGARLSEEDRDFLARMFPDANPSEALRALISQARAQARAPVSVDEAQDRLVAVLGGAGELRPEGGSRSVVVEDLVREALLVAATALVGPPAPGLEDAGARQSYEALIVDRAFDFTETLLRHCLSASAPAWNPQVVRARLAAARQTLVAALAASSPQHLPVSQG